MLGTFQIALHQMLKSKYTHLAGIKSLVSDAGHMTSLMDFCTLKFIIWLQSVKIPASSCRTHLQGPQVDKASKYVHRKERCSLMSILIKKE